MIEAGFHVLCNSGIADEYLEADKLLVVEIYRAMQRLADPHIQEANKTLTKVRDANLHLRLKSAQSVSSNDALDAFIQPVGGFRVKCDACS
jgi:hypothetical protein